MKNLNDMTLQELWQLFPITLSTHRTEWKQWACEEITILSHILAQFSPRINHIGSTALPAIQAKPIIDILVELPCDIDFSPVRPIMENSGYICMSQSGNRISFNKGYTPHGFAPKVFHIHVHRLGDNDEILFRDYLIANPSVALQYETLKLSLLPRYRNDRDGYTEAKTEFIKTITDKARLAHAINTLITSEL